MHPLLILVIVLAMLILIFVVLARKGAYPFCEFMNSYNEIHAFVFGVARVFGLLQFNEMSVAEYKASIEEEHAYYVGGKLTGRFIQVLPGIIGILYELGILTAWGLI
jgi:hypothetical protein